MARYVDGFVLPIQKDRVEDYRKIADEAGNVWLKYGALEYVECVAEDVKVGEVTSFPRSVALEDDETVVFAWIVFESRAHRDEVNAKVMDDPFMKGGDPSEMPGDMKRMVYGGFDVIVDLEAG